MTSLLEECVCVRVCSCSFWCVLMCHFLCAGMQLKSGDLAIIASLLEKKTIKVVIDSTYSLYEIDKAHQRSETHRARGERRRRPVGQQSGLTDRGKDIPSLRCS